MGSSSNIITLSLFASAFADVVPEIVGGVAARSVLWGFEPFYMDTLAVRQALEKILFDEWKLPSK